MKPILFNTEMVRAILDGRKSCTRRVVKHDKAQAVLSSPARLAHPELPDERFIRCLCDAPYEPGDILWVRETWAKQFGVYWYKAGSFPAGATPPEKWHPSIHMPREAARLFLRVTNVRVERLQEITETEIEHEGIIMRPSKTEFEAFIAQKAFALVWDSTIKPTDLPLYGWSANPWVWVIQFARISREEATPHA